MFKYFTSFLPILIFLDQAVNAQIGVDTVQYQWAGHVNSTSGLYCGVIQYTFYPNGAYLREVTGTTAEHEKGNWKLQNKTIKLNWDKVGEGYIYQGSFKLRKNCIKWTIDPGAIEYMGLAAYRWFSWTKSLKYKRVKQRPLILQL